ncbi:unnamed protein product [Bursaphelenchus okinawaensis]|uniref:Uncharacterized protein n=1 Tax=Bursaphelenchus okinawaensis TaxID=465554 RepID=A0A811LPW2_9BILA|nr:unnamed protein product [Bursaphelenchus okinawaensis]CAG9127714.1 unnamed protein product [Bursaphelenchus okinawaensis]
MRTLVVASLILSVAGVVYGGDIEKLAKGFDAAQRELIPKLTAGLTGAEAALVRVLADNRVKSATAQMQQALNNKTVQKVYRKLLKTALEKVNADEKLIDYLVEVVKQQDALQELGQRSPRGLKAFSAIVEKFDKLSLVLKRKIAFIDPSAGRLFRDRQLRALAKTSTAAGIHKSSESSSESVEKSKKSSSSEAVETAEDASGVPVALKQASKVPKELEAVPEVPEEAQEASEDAPHTPTASQMAPEQPIEELEHAPHLAAFSAKKKAKKLPTHSINFGVIEKKTKRPEGVPVLNPDITIEDLKKLAAESLGFKKFRRY